MVNEDPDPSASTKGGSLRASFVLDVEGFRRFKSNQNHRDGELVLEGFEVPDGFLKGTNGAVESTSIAKVMCGHDDHAKASLGLFLNMIQLGGEDGF